MSTVLRSVGLLDVLSSTSAGPRSRALYPRRLRASLRNLVRKRARIVHRVQSSYQDSEAMTFCHIDICH